MSLPKRYTVVVMPKASAGIMAAHRFISKRSPQNADLVVDRLFAAIDSLEILPHRCSVHQSHTNPDRVIRSMPVSSYILYYRVHEADAVVEVMMVRHGSRGGRPDFG